MNSQPKLITDQDGSDLPTATFGSVTQGGTFGTGSSGVSTQALYLTEAGDTSAISVNDIHQGGIGDCFLLSPIGELALFHPSVISQMIHDNGDGTETVALYGDASGGPVHFGTGSFVVVPQLVTNNFSGNAVNGGSYDMVNGVKEIWPQVLEEAYAQANGGYASIQNGGNPAIAMEALTGQFSTMSSPSSMTVASLTADIAAGDLLTFDTGSSPAFGLVGDHSYMFESLQTVGGVAEVQLGNPWGYNQPPLIPVAQLSSAFMEVDVGQVGPTVPTPAPAPAPAPTPTPAPSAITIGSGADVLALSMSEDAWQGDAQFTVSVDGVQIGGTQTTTASHAAGQTQVFNVKGNFAAGSHTATVNFLNDAWGGSAATDRNLYVGGATIDGSAVASSALTLLGGGPQSFSFNGAGATTDTLDLHMSEDAWQGDAQFKVLIDGALVGGIQTATASHAAGATQDFSFAGSWGAGQHTVGVQFINDAWGGSASMDRNLYIDQVTYDGRTANGAPAALQSNGTANFNAPAAGPSTALTLHLAEDAWRGDAQYSVSIDGVSVISNGTATASNAQGQSQAVNLHAALSAGVHDIAISFLNDAWGGSAATDRNLYVKGIDVNGTPAAGASASLFSNGTDHFQIAIPSN